jgi:hypothetical protein
MIYGCLKIQQLLAYRGFPFASRLADSGFPFSFSFGELRYFVLCHQGFISIQTEKSAVSALRYLHFLEAGM